MTDSSIPTFTPRGILNEHDPRQYAEHHLPIA
jgi:hypothetical protein